MSDPTSALSESGGVQDFIRDRQVGVLERAIVSLRECSDDDLAAQTHRLSGTLGTYQLESESRAVRDLYDWVRTDGTVGSPTTRGQVIDALTASLEARTAAAGRPTPS